MLIDSHCHLLSSEYDDVSEQIEKAFSSGIDAIIINGYDVESSKEAVNLSKKYENVYAAVGIGPENVNNITETDIKLINELASLKKVVAIGEIGLDYYWTKENKDIQVNVFKSMLDIAQRHKLPVIVHSREAINDTYNILKEFNSNGILHCYSGSKEMAKEFIKIGFLIGIGGVVTFKNAKKLKEVVKEIPLKYISLETDSPYLTPEPYRGKQNNPCYLKYVVRELSNIKDVSEEEVINITGEAVALKFDLK